MIDIPLADAMVVWDPYEEDTIPPVKVVGGGTVERPDVKDDTRYSSSWGRCQGDFIDASDNEKLLQLFNKFVEITVGDGVDPAAVHEAFLVIPEYRRPAVVLGASSRKNIAPRTTAGRGPINIAIAKPETTKAPAAEAAGASASGREGTQRYSGLWPSAAL